MKWELAGGGGSFPIPTQRMEGRPRLGAQGRSKVKADSQHPGPGGCNGRGALRSPALAHILLLSPPMGLPCPYPQGLCRSMRQNKEHCWNVFAETLGSSILDYLIPTSLCWKGSSRPTLVSLKWKLEHSLAFIFLSQRECELLECPVCFMM